MANPAVEAIENSYDTYMEYAATKSLMIEEEDVDIEDMYSAKPLTMQIEQILLNVFSAQELREEDIPPLEWIAEEILPVGITILGGTPKAGKSLLALDLALAVSTGQDFLGNVPTLQGKVMYFTYEDTKRRLQNRIKEKMEDAPDVDLSALFFNTALPSRSKGGLSIIEELVEKIGGIRLVVIDTLAYFVGEDTKQGYSADYQMMAELSNLANKLNVALLVLHHTTKAKPGKWKQALYGSNGVVGGADGLFLLDRNEDSPKALLRVAGRDLKEQVIHLELAEATWVAVPPQAADHDHELDAAFAQSEVRDILAEADAPLTLGQVVERTGKSKQNVWNFLTALVEKGLVCREGPKGRSTYTVAPPAELAGE